MTEEKQKAWRFYRSNLSTIVWDSENDKPLADFSEGYFTTDDQKVAEKLLDFGYLEIPLDSTSPPSDIIIRQPVTVIDGDVPVMRGQAVNEKIAEARMSNMTKEISAGKPPALKVKKGGDKSRKRVVRKK